MFQVKKMRPQDFDFATDLANTMDWKMAPEDFQYAISLEPEGSFVLFDSSKPVGIATSISYGKVGWFGNLIVKEDFRGRGAGNLLVKHAVDYLRGKGVEKVGLYAYAHLVGFYANQDFRADEDFSVLHTPKLSAINAGTLLTVGTQQIERIAKLDGQCFGGDRKRLLESIILEEGNLSYYHSKGNEVVGYVAATVYETMAWVGPLICQEADVEGASGLLRAVLSKLMGKSVYMVLPKKEVAITKILYSLGFKQDFSVVRMFNGANSAKNCIYLAESLERG
jgi:GNAT superfamily N-acetyltransferase